MRVEWSKAGRLMRRLRRLKGPRGLRIATGPEGEDSRKLRPTVRFHDM
jgi:hypothetical protein